VHIPHLFEFGDQTWLPGSLRATLFDILDACNSQYRDFYGWVADAVLNIVREEGITTVVELGAGRAPVTRALVCDDRSGGLTLVPCDLVPDVDAYRELERLHPGTVVPRYESIDFTIPRAWPAKTLLVLTASLHHVPRPQRPAVVAALTANSARVAVFEPISFGLLSTLISLGSLLPALLLPITSWNRAGRLRRLLWCWLIPAAPLMFLWDAVVGCLRQWSRREWETELDLHEANSRRAQIVIGLHSQQIVW
jgi:hypothetical protein